jgi:hypothetical protein
MTTPPAGAPLRLIIAGDQASVRQGLVLLLGAVALRRERPAEIVRSAPALAAALAPGQGTPPENSA